MSTSSRSYSRTARPSAAHLNVSAHVGACRRAAAGRAASALFAMVVAAAVATAMLNLYVDVQAKLRSEFRNYGANIVVVGKRRAALPADALTQVDSVLGERALAVPFALVVARTADGQSVVVAGTDFDRVQKLDRLVVGERMAESLRNRPWLAFVPCRWSRRQGKPFDLSFQGRRCTSIPAGTVQTGAAEDSRIYMSLADFEAWTGHPTIDHRNGRVGSAEEVNRHHSNAFAGAPGS